jgi:hypothetical protein
LATTQTFGLLRDAFPGEPLGEITKKNKKQLRCHFAVWRGVFVSKLPTPLQTTKATLTGGFLFFFVGETGFEGRACPDLAGLPLKIRA